MSAESWGDGPAPTRPGRCCAGFDGSAEQLGADEGYDEVLADTITLAGPVPVRVLDLPRLIQVKTAAGRAKDRLALPLLIATLDERRR